MTETDQIDMYQQAYRDVQNVLDAALGPNEVDGAGAGIAADVQLLADQRDQARAALADRDETHRALVQLSYRFALMAELARKDADKPGLLPGQRAGHAAYADAYAYAAEQTRALARDGVR